MKVLNGAIESVNAAALLLGAATLLSRILGVLRDRLLAAHFGAGRELDMYYAAFQIPDFMSILFVLGAGSAAILPIFQEYWARDRVAARKLIADLIILFFLGSSVVTVVGFFLAPYVMPLIVPGFSQEEQDFTTVLARIMMLSPILLGLSSILSAVTQSFQRFWSFALAPVLYNIGIIVGILVFFPWFGLGGLALGVILGAIFHLLIQFMTVRDLGLIPYLAWRGVSSGVRKVCALSFPRVISVSLSQLTILVLVLIGSTLAQGSIAIFQFAQNLYALPIGLFGGSYSIAIFPSLSRAYINRNPREFFEKLFLGIRTVLFWIAPSTVLFIVLRAHIVRVALGAGAFSWEDTRLTAAVLAVLACAMAAGALASLLIKGFYALENTWVPLAINIGASLLSILLAFFFSHVLSQDSAFAHVVGTVFRISDLAHPEVLGLALGFSIGLMINISLLYKALHRLAEKTFQERSVLPIAPLIKIIGAALLSGVVAYAVRASFSAALPLISFGQVLLQGALAGIFGLAAYFGALFLLKEEDVTSLWQTIRHKLFRVGVLPPSWDGEHMR